MAIVAIGLRMDDSGNTVTDDPMPKTSDGLLASRPADRDSRHGKSLATWARKAPLRNAREPSGAMAKAPPVELPGHLHFDDLPVPPEENLAAVQPNLALPDEAPRAEEPTLPDGNALLPAPPPERPQQKLPQWLANAVEPPLTGRGPLIAIVIDDVGIDQEGTVQAVRLPSPLTLAFIPYGYNLEELTRQARRRGHELLVHMPMEPSSTVADPGPNALLTSLPTDEIMRRFRWGLSRFDGYVGVSNHMGSRFMARSDLVQPILDEVERRGLLFLDSWTRADTAGTELARGMGLPNTRRDVFLDNEQTEDEVTMRLAQLEKVARRKGYAVGLGHPHEVTLDVLEKWIPQARARGITLVPISTIVRLDYGEGFERMLAAATGGREPNRFLGGAE